MKINKIKQKIAYGLTLAMGFSSCPNLLAVPVSDAHLMMVAHADEVTTEGAYELESDVSEEVKEDLNSISRLEGEQIYIGSAADLEMMRSDLAGHYVLAQDIDLQGATWKSLGTESKPFTGSLDGNGFEISNFTISGGSLTGFFGVANDASITDLTLSDFSVKGTDHVGGLVGKGIGSALNIANCQVLDATIVGRRYVGGLLGRGMNTATGTIEDCIAEAEITGTGSGHSIGGLIGSYYGDLEACYFKGDIDTKASHVGGLIGYAYDGSYKACYSHANIIGADHVGGLVGYKVPTKEAVIQESFALGHLTGESYVSGLIGKVVNKPIQIENCYAATQMIGDEDVYGLTNESSRLEIINSYYDALSSKVVNTIPFDVDRITNTMINKQNYEGWDFESIWDIDEEVGYPYLRNLTNPDQVSLVQFEIEGQGTAENPYLITNKAQLDLMRYELSAHYKLACDINLNDEEWEPIGKAQSPFTGHLEGNGYTISSFVINGKADSTGFFAYTNGCEISNLTLKDFVVVGNQNVGGLIGTASGEVLLLTNCHTEAGIITGVSKIGGLIGVGEQNMVGDLVSCSSNVKILPVQATSTSPKSVGGLVGVYYGNMKQCYFEGIIDTNLDYVGGLVGTAPQGSYEECYSEGEITAHHYVGGLIGARGSEDALTITDSYVAGNLVGELGVGGLIGKMASKDTHISNCYVASEITADTNAYGLLAVSGFVQVENSYYDVEKTGVTNATKLDIARPTSEMITKDNFTNWNFDEIWTIEDGKSYPQLRYTQKPSDEETPGEGTPDDGDKPGVEEPGEGNTPDEEDKPTVDDTLGTEQNPYIIRTKEDFDYVREHLDGYYKLGNNIDLGGMEWEPIGTFEEPFTGHFEGDRYRISNFKVTDMIKNIGFFGVVNNAYIARLHLSGVTMIGVNYIGGLIGACEGDNTVIDNCQVSSGFISGGNYIGGLIGSHKGGTISESSYDGVLKGTGFAVGGIVGETSGNAKYTYSLFIGELTGNSYVGGLVGIAYNEIEISYCHVIGPVIGNEYVESFIGSGNAVGRYNNYFPN